MAVIVLAALGVPLWMVVGALAAGIWSRRSFQRAEDDGWTVVSVNNDWTTVF